MYGKQERGSPTLTTGRRMALQRNADRGTGPWSYAWKSPAAAVTLYTQL